MQVRYPPRVYVLVVMMCVMATGWSLVRLTRASRFESAYSFEVQFRRLAPLREALGGAPRAAYFTNVGDSGNVFTQLYGPTQYVLAPTLLVPVALDKESPLVVGDYTRQDDYAAIGNQQGLRVAAEFPMGAVLYERAEGEASTTPQQPQDVQASPVTEGIQ